MSIKLLELFKGSGSVGKVAVKVGYMDFLKILLFQSEHIRNC